MLGICAGAYLASCDYSWSLNLIDAKVLDKAHWNRGNGNVEVALSPLGRKLLESEKPSTDIYYNQGPLLAPANNPDIPDYEEVGKFVGEIAKNGAPNGCDARDDGDRSRRIRKRSRLLLQPTSRENRRPRKLHSRSHRLVERNEVGDFDGRRSSGYRVVMLR